MVETGSASTPEGLGKYTDPEAAARYKEAPARADRQASC